MSVDFSNFDFAGLQAAMAGVQQQVSTPQGRAELQAHLDNPLAPQYTNPSPPPPAVNNTPDPRIAELEQRLRDLENARVAQEKADREAASAFLSNVLKMYGMDGLAGQVDNLIRQWGNSTDVIALKLKDTSEYKTRFKGLLALQQKGITDVSNEAEYINLESSYRKVFRDAGLQSYIGDAGTANERDAIARLVGDFSLSVDEVQSRVQDAQRIVADETPDEVKNALTRYYNVSTSDLVAYTLDPAKAKNKINEMANTAIVGGYAGRAGLDASLSTARDIANASAGDQDLNGAALMDRFASAKDIYSSTSRLAQIEKGALSSDDALNTEFNLNDEAKKRVKGLQSRERARFSGSSGFTTGSLSTSSGV